MGMFSFLSNIFNNKLSPEKINQIIDSTICDEDKDLISDQDIIWINSLNSNDIEKILQEDDMFRFGRFKSLKDSGLNTNESIKSILHDFPFFYLDKDKKTKMPGNEDIWKTLNDDDMRLPFCIKDRFNKFLMSVQYNDDLKNKFQYYITNSSSANSAIRKMIRNNIF